MSESKFETVSSLVDNFQHNDAELEGVLNDKQLSDTWERYHLIGDVMREETAESIQLDLSSQISAAIAEEPTILAPKETKSAGERFKAKVVQLVKPVGQMAIAASAAGLMILGVQQNVADSDTVVPSPVIQTVPLGGIADPVSFNYQQNDRASQQQAYMEQQRRFQALLSDHKQQVKLHSSVKQNEETLTDEASEQPK